MKKKTTEPDSESRATWENLERALRSRVQAWLQDLLEEEVTELLGRRKSERAPMVDASRGYRNGVKQ